MVNIASLVKEIMLQKGIKLINKKEVNVAIIKIFFLKKSKIAIRAKNFFAESKKVSINF